MLRRKTIFLRGIGVLVCTMLITVCLICIAVADDDEYEVWEDGATNDRAWGYWLAWAAGFTEVEVSNEWSSTGDTSLKAYFTAMSRDLYTITFSPQKLDVDDLADVTSVKIDLYNPHDISVTMSLQFRDNWGREIRTRGPEFQEGAFVMGPMQQGVHEVTFDLTSLWIWPERKEMSKEEARATVQDIKDITIFLGIDGDSIDNVNEFHSYVYFDNIRIRK